MEKSFAALLLPTAWRLADHAFPIILMEDKDCDTTDPFNEMNNDASQSERSCYISSKTFFLVGFNNQDCE